MELSAFLSQIEAKNFPVKWPGQWIHGEWHAVKKTGTWKESLNPNTGGRLIEVGLDKDSIATAIERSTESRAAIAALPLEKRVDILRNLRQALADYQNPVIQILRIEAGKPAWEAREDLEAALKYLDCVTAGASAIMDSIIAPARLGPGRGAFQMLPIGVTAAYIPFSTPLTSAVFYTAAAVIAGCPIILNSSAHASLSATLFALLAQSTEAPPSMINVIFGNFSTFRQLISDKRIAAILYTGSREHCDSIRSESKAIVGRQVVLQSGGKNAVIVHSSADISHAVKCVVYGALKTGGQRCTSTSRVFVYRSHLPEFRARLTEAFKNIKIGRTDGADEDVFMGPLYSAKSVDKFLRFQTMANRESETILWGKAMEHDEGGFFVTPSLHYVSKFDNTSAYQGNVLFSPDVAIYEYDVLEDAISCINTTDAAFAVSFIGDPEVIGSRRHLFLAPNLLINTPTVESEATLPLAGRLQSGHHRFHGPGISLYLCYPQVLSQDPDTEKRIKTWPWPAF